MALIADLIAKLKRRAQIAKDGDEPRVFIDSFLQELIEASTVKHNARLTVDTLTPAEEQAVLLLAQIEMCYVRAQMHAGDQPIKTGAQVSQPAYLSKTPYDNWISLAAKLTGQYQTLCESLGMDS